VGKIKKVFIGDKKERLEGLDPEIWEDIKKDHNWSFYQPPD